MTISILSATQTIIVADVTGDDRPDLVVLVHDRVLVYPQDTPVDPKAVKKAPAKAVKE